MKNYKRNKWKDSFYYSSRTRKVVLVFLLLLFLFSLTIGFSLLSRVLSIGTNTEIRPDRDIRITNVEGPILSNGAYENGNYQYSHDLLVSKGVLPNQNATITYKITITNNSSNNKLIEEIRDELNGNITYEITDYKVGIDEIPAGESVTITLVIKNNGTSSTTYSAEFNFIFGDVYIDITPPTITFNPEPDSIWKKENITVKISATDDVEVTDFKYCLTNSSICTPTTDADPNGTNILIQTDGKYTICTTATDNAKTPHTTEICSNVGDKYYQIDKTAPTISSLTAQTTLGLTNTVTAKVIDSQSGITGYAWTTTNNQPNTFTNVSATTSEQTYTYTAKENGTVYFWVTDAAGHVSSKSVEVTMVATPHARITAYDNSLGYTTCETVQCALDELYDLYGYEP